MTDNIKGTLTRLSSDFSRETLQARREWHGAFKMMKGKKLQPRILYPANFRLDGEIKIFTDRQKLREVSNTISALHQMLETFLYRKHKRKKRPTETYPKQESKW